MATGTTPDTNSNTDASAMKFDSSIGLIITDGYMPKEKIDSMLSTVPA